MTLLELLPHAERAASLLKARKETVAVAESSAGGLISAALLAMPGASVYYVGGAVTYTRPVLLHLSGRGADELAKLNGATEEFTLLAARSVRERYRTGWGVGESGAAGPSGNRYGDPPGHTVVAVTGPIEHALVLRTGDSDRLANMHAFAAAALKLLADSLAAA
ncbi:MAG: CinA family protein [Betaproteobacteria bacterium]|nr:CinA family protein [Betaproteobacteria bacterium]MDH3437109.1 CinA family protein [Betaproteobacteria bacterium]